MMPKHRQTSFLLPLLVIIILAILFLFIFWHYQPQINYSLIIQYLEAKSIASSNQLLNSHSLSLISTATSKPILIFPSLFLIPLTLLQASPTLILPFIYSAVLKYMVFSPKSKKCFL